MKYKIKKRPSGSYTIVYKEHWYNKWNLYNVRQRVYIENDILQQTFPKFVAYEEKPFFVAFRDKYILQQIIDSIWDGTKPIVDKFQVLRCDPYTDTEWDDNSGKHLMISYIQSK